MIGSDAIVKCLEKENVKYVFGYPGVAICPFYNSILKSDIKSVLIRTEQNAAHAASGLADVYECCMQLRGECGEHQVKNNPKTAMLRGYGGSQNVATVVLRTLD